jgi:hypothetical protein
MYQRYPEEPLKNNWTELPVPKPSICSWPAHHSFRLLGSLRHRGLHTNACFNILFVFICYVYIEPFCLLNFFPVVQWLLGYHMNLLLRIKWSMFTAVLSFANCLIHKAIAKWRHSSKWIIDKICDVTFFFVLYVLYKVKWRSTWRLCLSVLTASEPMDGSFFELHMADFYWTLSGISDFH